jgi:hypothetical protein
MEPHRRLQVSGRFDTEHVSECASELSLAASSHTEFREGNLIIGQQQYSGDAVARLVSASLIRVARQMRDF